MKTLNYKFPEFEQIEIVTLCDFHIGNEFSDVENAKKQIEYVKNKENAFAIVNGDLCETATKTSVGDVYNSKNPMQEIEQIVELLDPIKEKILCYNTGNHERRIERESGVDISKLVCMQLGIAERYTQIGACLCVRVGRGNPKTAHRPICYTIYVTHGSGGGKTAGGKVNKCVSLTQLIDTDVYIYSHIHEPAVVKRDFMRVDVFNGNVNQITKLFVNCGSSLKFGGYAEINGYAPSTNITPVITLQGREKVATAQI